MFVLDVKYAKELTDAAAKMMLWLMMRSLSPKINRQIPIGDVDRCVIYYIRRDHLGSLIVNKPSGVGLFISEI